jgi:hypothetical protein
MHDFLLILLKTCAAVTCLVGSVQALQAMANPRLITRGKATPGVRMLAFLAAARSLVVAAATGGAIIVSASEALLWLAGVGVALQFLDSIHGQVENHAIKTLAPLGLGLLQLVLLILVVATMARSG